AHAKHLPLIRFEHFEAQAVRLDHLADARNVPGHAIQEAGESGCARFFHHGIEIHCEELADFVYGHAAAQDHRATLFADHVGRWATVFFADFADDLFDQILEGDDAGHQAVFVDDHGHLLIFELHFLQQFGAELRFRDEEGRANQFAHGAAPGFAGGHLEHVARDDDSRDVVEIFVVDRHAGKFRLDDEAAQIIKRGAGGDRDDIRARRHHLRDALIAEFNHLLDQARFVALDDAFFGGRVHEGFDGLLVVHGRAGFLLGNSQDRNRQFEYGLNRPENPDEHAHRGHQRGNPIAAHAHQQERGKELHRYDDFGAEEHDHLGDGFPGARNEEDDASRRERGDQHQPEAGEEGESERGAAAVSPEARLDFRLEDVEVLAGAARDGAAQIAVDAIKIGEHHQAQDQAQHA